ncbi:MAG: type I methionyl aminopeptidase [Spirochaetales bacterium]|nr:type I methionyl aminopeptidase [Spirochaetales bacterium]
MALIKDSTEIAGIRDSSRLLADTFRFLRDRINEGVTPIYLDGQARKFIEKAGGKPSFLGYSGFPASICVSVNKAVIHGIPDKRPFQEGDVVGIDCGVILNGYFSDSAYTFPIGKITPEIKKLLTITKESLYLGIDQGVVGNRVKDISRAVYRHVIPHGYGVVRSYCGHGVGLAIHEDPQVPNYPGSGPNPRLKPGMVLAIEPMINLGGDDVKVLDDDWTVVTRDGSISAHYEHTILVTEDGPEILTLWE